MIRRTLSAVALTLMLVACGDSGSGNAADTTANGIINSITSTLKDATSAVDTVKDEATANTAVPKITDALSKFKDLKSQFEGVKDVSMTTKATGLASITGGVAEVASKINGLKTAYPKAYEIVVGAVKKLGIPGLDTLL